MNLFTALGGGEGVKIAEPEKIELGSESIRMVLPRAERKPEAGATAPEVLFAPAAKSAPSGTRRISFLSPPAFSSSASISARVAPAFVRIMSLYLSTAAR